MARAKKGDTAGARRKPAKTGKEGGSAALDTLKKNFSSLSKKDRANFIADPFLWDSINVSGRKRDRQRGIEILKKGLETKKRKKDDDDDTGLRGLRLTKTRKTDTKGSDAEDSDSDGDGETSEEELKNETAAQPTKALEKTGNLDSVLKSEIKEAHGSEQLNGVEVENSGGGEDLPLSVATESKGQSVVARQLEQVRQPYFGPENRPKWPPEHEQLSGQTSQGVKNPLSFLLSAIPKSKGPSAMAYRREQVGVPYFGPENRPKSLSESGEFSAPDILPEEPGHADVVSTAIQSQRVVEGFDNGPQSDSLNASLDKMNKASEVEKVAPTKEWETNPWAITMDIARGCLKKDDDALLESVCIDTLRELQEWQPDRAANRTFTILNRVENIQHAQPNIEKKDIPSQIQDQVYGLAKASSSDELHRPALFFWLSQLASTIDEHECTGFSTAVGRSTLSAVYDMYVKAEYPSHEAYKAAKLHDAKAVSRKRDAWKRKKETGGKVLRLTKEFGLGVVICIPTDITYSRIERMPVGKVELLRHGLKNGPDAQDFRHVCSTTGEWITDFVTRRISAQDFKRRIFKDIHSAMTISGNLINGIKDEHECVEQLNATIRKFPVWMRSTSMGSLGASPTVADIQTLAMHRDINDEVIRTVLGLKLQQIYCKRNASSFPSYSSSFQPASKSPAFSSQRIMLLGSHSICRSLVII